MTDHLEELVPSLLWERYALYPYTPGATKNATPTPFGIVYPPAYAAECAGAFDHARLECIADPEPDADFTATLRYLAADGARRVELGPARLGQRVTTNFDGGRLTLRSELRPNGGAFVRCCVHNVSDAPGGLDRAGALAHSLISTQLLVRIS